MTQHDTGIFQPPGYSLQAQAGLDTHSHYAFIKGVYNEGYTDALTECAYFYLWAKLVIGKTCPFDYLFWALRYSYSAKTGSHSVPYCINTVTAIACYCHDIEFTLY